MCPCIIINQSNFPSLLLWHLFSDEVLMTTYQSHGITALPNDTDPILRPNPKFFLEKPFYSEIHHIGTEKTI